MSTVTFTKTFTVDGVLTNATTFKLSNAAGTIGIKRDDTDAVVVADNTAMTNVSTGLYSYTIDKTALALPDGLTYTAHLEAVYAGSTIRGSYTFTDGSTADVAETAICNQALSRLGAGLLTSLAIDTSVQAVQCRLHYAPARDALLRGHDWAFAMGRVALVATTTPIFGYGYAFTLPTDSLRIVSIHERHEPYRIEGGLLLTDGETASVKYIRAVTDTTEFDTLFAKALVVALALELVMPLAQDKTLRVSLGQELGAVIAQARLADVIESQGEQEHRNPTWNQSRHIGVQDISIP